MKPVNMIITAIALFALSLTNAQASDRQVGGLILGGGTGAIVGQAVGRNVESTIVGATVGGVLGLIVGSELDRHHGSVNQHSQVVAHSPQYNTRRYDTNPRPVFRKHHRNNHYRDYPRPVFRKHHRNNHYRDYPRYRHDSGNCTKIVTIKEGRHKTRRVVSTVCGNSPRNNHKSHNPYRYNDRSYR
jgi:hypothetical protein